MDSFRTFIPSEMPLRERHQMLLSGVAPRPIAFVGTLSTDKAANLSPFSFFNAFGANPPYLGFSPAYRGTDGTPKDTFKNVLANRECTVSIVSHAMTDQMNLASAEFPYGVDEFEKAGFGKAYGNLVAAPFVAESPFAMECRLSQFLSLGGQSGSGNLLIVEVVAYHVQESILDSRGRIDPRLLDPIGRMGGNFYSRAKAGIFELAKPEGIPIGFDALPSKIRNSNLLTGKDLSRLASVTSLPTFAAELPNIHGCSEEQLHLLIKEQLDLNNLETAWALILQASEDL